MVYILLGNGFEETEAVAPIDLLRRAGIEVLTVGIQGKLIEGGHGIRVQADICLDEMDLSKMEMIVLPGGLGGVASIRSSKAAMDAIAYAHQNGKLIGAICAGPTVLADLKITDSKTVTCYPGCEKDMGKARVVENAACATDGKIITGTSAGCAIPFGLALITALKGRDAANMIAQQIVIR